ESAVIAWTLKIDVVHCRFQSVNWHTCIKCHLYGDIVTGACSLLSNRRRNPRAIGHAIGILSPSAALLACRAAGNVTRSDTHRKHKLVGCVIILKSFDITDCYVDALTWHDVGD